MNRIELTVPGISCSHCKESIEGAVGGLTGVESVRVDVDAKTVEVVFGGNTTAEDIVRAIEDQGYDVAR
ncbi:MAG: copper chaperone CopZ [Acidimicrobiia bacterium]|nr:MAG: copper chaperone CopZ [Acidimicrobiia bacterium]